MTCGQELSSSAEVPEKIDALMRHVAENLVAHADWVGERSPEARAERDAMRAVAQGYRAMADAAAETARIMRSFEALAPAEHPPDRFDAASFRTWMLEKIRLQRELAAVILEHAASRRALEQGSLNP